MKPTQTELNVLKVMSEKDTDWNWMVLDRMLAVNQISGFGNVANIVLSLVKQGFVSVVPGDTPSKPRYRVSEQGRNYLFDVGIISRT
ncbi:MarR family transcriptional regulator [Mangrovibacter phragmitis]|uniref:MarR family transcriptional regulator n=1 Tax=Mangrovibacter phragmitis TaxID=1691903 RepID=UPI00336AE7F9